MLTRMQRRPNGCPPGCASLGIAVLHNDEPDTMPIVRRMVGSNQHRTRWGPDLPVPDRGAQVQMPARQSLPGLE